jgi:FKBP-type peptidyl-prolyl cis-trans isomerase 2
MIKFMQLVTTIFLKLIDGEYVNERYLDYNDRLNSKTIVYNNEIYSIKSDTQIQLLNWIC